MRKSNYQKPKSVKSYQDYLKEYQDKDEGREPASNSGYNQYLLRRLK